jgi:hypothetical protein
MVAAQAATFIMLSCSMPHASATRRCCTCQFDRKESTKQAGKQAIQLSVKLTQ